MKYYLVNYLILNNKSVTENENIGITTHAFANIKEFKRLIAAKKNAGSDTDNIVIKSYEQISMEAFNSLSNVN